MGQPFNLPFEQGDLVLDVPNTHLGSQLRLAVCPIEFFHIADDAPLDLLYTTCLDLAFAVIPVPVVHRLELAAVDGNFAAFEHVEFVAQQNELSADIADRLAIVFAEVGNGLEVWREPVGQPHPFDVALGFTLQAPARLNPAEIPIY